MARAIRVDAEPRFTNRRLVLREWFRESLTAVPALCIVAALILAAVTGYAHRYLLAPGVLPDWLTGSTASAISVTSVIASSILSFLAVVLSVTLVAVQLASQQFSPRVVRAFVRSIVVKITLGLGTGTFAYSLLLLYFAINRTEATVALPAVAVDVALVFVTIVAFVLCMREILALMRLGHLLTMIANETHRSIESLFLPLEAHIECPPVSLRDPRQVVRYVQGQTWGVLRRAPEGVFRAVSNRQLVELARRHDCRIRVLPRPGDYIVDGQPVLEVFGDVDLPPEECVSTFFVERERTVEQDPACGLRSLVDVALQALSPAVNAPTTATQVLQRLTGLLLDMARRPMPTGCYADAEGAVRLVRPVVAWKEYVELAFREIIEYGASSSQTCVSIDAALTLLLAEVPEECRQALIDERLRLSALMPAATVEPTTPFPPRFPLVSGDSDASGKVETGPTTIGD